MRSLLQELKRRRVFRVAGIYGIVSWIIAEVADVVFPALQLPEWTVTFVIALLILGFPVAMFFAWVFDIGPQGIERTEPAEHHTSGIPTWERVAYVALVVVAMGVMAYFFYPGDQSLDTERMRDSIAVLPFSNLSQDEANDYFSDGMSEELLNMLAKVPNLRVAARTSSFAFKGENVDIREVARQLGVDTVLEGSVRRAGNRVRITAQLIDAETGYHLWSNNYDRELEDIFAVQDEISTEIVKALKVTLAGGEGEKEAPVLARAAPTENVEAYQLYLQARHQWKRRGVDALQKSVELLQQALQKDPEFARAYAGLAAAYVVLPGYLGEPDPTEYHEKAANAARQALARDPNLAEAHAVLAEIDIDKWNWADAEAAFFFATTLDPNDATTHHWYSMLLRNAGRMEAAMEVSLKAFELDPASPVINNNLAQMYMAMGYDEQAVKYYESAIQLGLASKNEEVIYMMAAIRRDDMDTLMELLKKNPRNRNLPPEFYDLIVAVGEDQSRWPELEALFAREDFPIPEQGLFSISLLMGQAEKTLEIALKYADDQSFDPGMLWMPEAAALRRLPDFAKLVEKIGLLDYWKQYGWPDDCRPVGDALQCGFSSLAAAN